VHTENPNSYNIPMGYLVFQIHQVFAFLKMFGNIVHRHFSTMMKPSPFSVTFIGGRCRAAFLHHDETIPRAYSLYLESV